MQLNFAGDFTLELHQTAETMSLARKATLVFMICLLTPDCRAEDSHAPIPIAHRGLLRHAPENTLPAFSTCLDLGMGFELDIRTTKDGHLVVIHDETIERTTSSKSRFIQDMTLFEVQQLDAGGWFDPAFTGVRIPTLEETLALIKKRRRSPTIIALNVKQLTSDGESRLVELVDKYGLFEESFAFDQDIETSKRLQAIDARFRIGQNVNRDQFPHLLDDKSLNVFLLTFVPTPEEVAVLHKRQKQVLLNYAGNHESRRNPAVWKQVQEAKLDGILTDFPLEFRAVLRGRADSID